MTSMGHIDHKLENLKNGHTCLECGTWVVPGEDGTPGCSMCSSKTAPTFGSSDAGGKEQDWEKVSVSSIDTEESRVGPAPPSPISSIGSIDDDVRAPRPGYTTPAPGQRRRP